MRVSPKAVVLALGVPAFFALTTLSTLADTSPSPAPGSAASGATQLPGDPNAGSTVYAQNCAVCHGASLEGGIGAVLNPIDKLPGVPDSLDPNFLISVITNGRVHQAGDPKQTDMPAWSGKLTDQQIKDVAAFIIVQNHAPGGGALSPGELAKRTILWVSIAIIAMGFITYLLSAYNMRWIARRAAARNK